MSTLTQDINLLAHGVGISITGKLVGRGLNFLTQVLLARFLGPEIFGLFAIGWTIIRLISLISPLGLDQGIVRFGSEYWHVDDNKFRNIFRLSSGLAILSGGVIGVGLFLSSEWVAIVFFKKPGLEEVLRIFALSVPLITCLRVLANSTTIIKSTKYSIFSEELIQPGIELLLIAIFLTLGWGLQVSIWAIFFSFGVACTTIVYYTIRLFPEAYFGHNLKISIQELMLFSIPTAFAGLFGSLISWVDRLMVGYYLDERQTGIYTTVSLISILFVTILSGFKVIFAPLIAGLYNQGEKARVEEIYRVSTKWGLYLCIPFALICYFSTSEILATIFGNAYISGYLPLVILVTAQLVNVGTGALDLLLIMTGKNREWLFISGLMLVINVVVNMVLIPHYGIIGASIGTGLTVIGIFVLGLYYVKRTLKLWPYDRRYIKGILATGITIVGLFFISNLQLSPGLLYISIVTIVSFMLFVLALVLLGFDNEDKQLLRMIKQRIYFGIF